MPSSRGGSSPLSSATPSPRLNHSGLSLSNSGPGPSRLGSPNTSETEPLTESDLTDPEDEDEEEEEEEEEEIEEEEEETIEVMRHSDSFGERPPRAGDEEDEEDDEEEEDQVISSPTRHKRVPTDQSSDTGSLSPPPPSTTFKVKNLPGGSSPSLRLPVNDRAGDEDEDDLEPEAGGEAVENDTKKEEHAVFDVGSEVEDGDEEGDITMRPADDIEAVVEEKEIVGEEEEDGIVEDEDEEEDDAQLPVEAPEIAVDANEQDEEGAVDDIEEAEAEGETTEANATVPLPNRALGHVHSSHAPPPTPASIRSLLMLELKFAALRDKLFVERMEEAAAEEEMLLKGVHPALKFMHKTLTERRERLHEIASRRHEEALAELVRAREADKAHVWSWWTEERDRMHWMEFEETWSKRRKLAREKNDIETPRIVKPIPRAVDRSMRSFDWSSGAAPSKMSSDEAAQDLALMDPTRAAQVQQPVHAHAGPSRHASPAVYVPPVPQPTQPLPQEPASSSIPTATPGHAQAQAPDSLPNRRGPIPHNQPPPTFPYSQMHQAYNQRRAAEQAQSTSSAHQASPASAARPPAQTQSQQQAPRSQGRTVPTTSDMFESRKEHGSVVNNPWGADRRVNHLNGHKDPAASSNTASAGPEKATDLATQARQAAMANRFPNLADYLGRPAHPTTSVGNGVGGSATGGAGGGYGTMLNANKVLSPPKAGSGTGVLGSLNGRSPFASQSPSATPAGTSANRP